MARIPMTVCHHLLHLQGKDISNRKYLSDIVLDILVCLVTFFGIIAFFFFSDITTACHYLQIIALQRQHWRNAAMKEAWTSSYGERLAATVGTMIIVLLVIITDTEIADKTRLRHFLSSIPIDSQNVFHQ